MDLIIGRVATYNIWLLLVFFLSYEWRCWEHSHTCCSPGKRGFQRADIMESIKIFYMRYRLLMLLNEDICLDKGWV